MCALEHCCVQYKWAVSPSLCHSIVSAAIQNISDENVLQTEHVKQVEALKKHEDVSEEQCRYVLAIDVC